MILLLAATLAVLQGNPDPLTHELTQFERQLAATWRSGDCAGWGAMVAADWSVIHITGAVITKAEALETCKTGAAAIEAFELDELAVRGFGDAAVVTGRTTVTTRGAESITVRLRFTDVFVRRSGKWQVVASHATRIGS